MSDIAIKVEDLSKKFSIGSNTHSTLRDTLSNVLSKQKKEEFWALKDINFDIKKGEAVGIIGRNGAGKSTLLKILSKITRPTSGRIEINGRLSSLLEVGTGFHPELTGRENIFLNGSLLGMSKAEIKNKFDEIVDFSGVEKFIDTPVKHYSSGMYVRLAFAVAAYLNTEILLVDEVLAVGDAEFQKKCLGKMDEVTQRGKTVLIVSHDSNIIKSLTNRAILLNKGVIKSIENSKNIFDVYYGQDEISNYIRFDNAPLKSVQVHYVDRLEIEVDLNIPDNVDVPHFCFMISNSSGDIIGANNPKYEKLEIPVGENQSKMTISVDSPRLRYGKYFLSVWLANGAKNIFVSRDCVSFDVTTSGKNDRHLGFIIPQFDLNFDTR